MNQERCKGRFIKKGSVEKRKKKVLGMNEAKVQAAAAKKREAEAELSEDELMCVGRRIIEVSELGENLICCHCKQVLSLKDIVNEKRLGLNSIFRIRCQACCIETEVSTGKMHGSKKRKVELSDVNTKAVFGKFAHYILCQPIAMPIERDSPKSYLNKSNAINYLL